MGGRKAKVMESRRNMLEICLKPLLDSQESIGPEGLHEPLDRSIPESVLESDPIQIPFREAIIKGQEFVALTAGKIDIGIAEEGTEVVEGVTETHPLEVDEKGFSITDHHILGLQIPVYERAHRS